MKLGISGHKFCTDEPGGAVQATQSMYEHILKQSNLDGVVFGPESLQDMFEHTPIDNRYYLSESRLFGIGWEVLLLPQAARKHDIDILLSWTGTFKKTSDYNTVIYIHDMAPERGYASQSQTAYRKALFPRTFPKSDAIITVSEFSKREIHDILGINKRKIHVVPNGIDPIFHSDGRGVEFGLPDKYILYVGSLNPRKNIRRTINAYKSLRNLTGLSHELVIIGPSNKRAFNEMDINLTGIRTPGFIKKQELKYAYTNADLLVYPSLYEGFGLPPVEAMACGTPVLASNRSAFPEVIGDAAILVDPTDTEVITNGMIQILTQHEIEREHIRRGTNCAQQYTWEAASNEFVSVLRDLV